VSIGDVVESVDRHSRQAPVAVPKATANRRPEQADRRDLPGPHEQPHLIERHRQRSRTSAGCQDATVFRQLEPQRSTLVFAPRSALSFRSMPTSPPAVVDSASIAEHSVSASPTPPLSRQRTALARRGCAAVKRSSLVPGASERREAARAADRLDLKENNSAVCGLQRVTAGYGSGFRFACQLYSSAQTRPFALWVCGRHSEATARDRFDAF
jgi:hypothetical protein